MALASARPNEQC